MSWSCSSCTELVKRFLQVLRRLGVLRRAAERIAADLRTFSVSYFSRIFFLMSSSIWRMAARLGPNCGIWLGSMRIARASSSSRDFIHVAVGEHVLEQRRDHVGRLRGRAGDLVDRTLIRVDDPAERPLLRFT